MTPVSLGPPNIGTPVLCILCAYEKPWGVWDDKTGAAVCKECREAARNGEKSVSALEAALAAFLEADEERLAETDEAHAEAEKWRGEGDMYGHNFHNGRASGTISSSCVFYRVRRLLEKALGLQAPCDPPGLFLDFNWMVHIGFVENRRKPGWYDLGMLDFYNYGSHRLRPLVRVLNHEMPHIQTRHDLSKLMRSLNINPVFSDSCKSSTP